MAVPTPLFPPPSPASASSPSPATAPAASHDQSSGNFEYENSNSNDNRGNDVQESVPRGLSNGLHADMTERSEKTTTTDMNTGQDDSMPSIPEPPLSARADKMEAIAEDPVTTSEAEAKDEHGQKTAGSALRPKRSRARSTTSLLDGPSIFQPHTVNGETSRTDRSSSNGNLNVPLSPKGTTKATEGAHVHRGSSGEDLEGPGAMTPQRNQDKDKDGERILKLSPSKMHELTSSPQSIALRPVPESSPDNGRRVMSDNTYTTASRSGSGDGLSQPQLHLPSELRISTDVAKIQGSRDLHLDDLPEALSPGTRPVSSSSRNGRPHASRTVSTPSASSSQRQKPASSNNQRLAQTWSSRPRQDRPSITRMEHPESKHHHNHNNHGLAPPPQLAEPALPSPMPQSIPLPPVSIPTYLQLELASGRPSPLYIHRSATSDFPYESARVKLERLVNFLMLPPAVEQVLWFGLLACLDSWLYSFTILPLRFVKALYILLESWVLNLGVEFRFISGFVYNGVGRVWRRRNKTASNSAGFGEPQRSPDLDGRFRAKQEQAVERESRSRVPTEPRRRHRAETYRHHRRQKSIPSALLPDDKADILKGLLMIVTCWVLMRFDASRMYHWIRGQAAIKLYVIYNVLEVSDRLLGAIGQDVLECLFSREALERRPDGRSKVFRPFGLFLLALAYTVIHATSLFYQVMTLNVAVNSYSNALITLLLSNQFVEIKSTVFKKFEKENLFQLTCADVVERFQLWLMLTIIASRNIVETGAFNFVGSLGSTWSLSGNSSTSTNSTPLSTPPRTASSILPQSFTIFPSSLIASFSQVNTFLPSLAQVLGPFLVVLGSEILVDWLKHAYINKFNNIRPNIYGRFLDILAKDYYTNAFGDQNLTRRLGLPVIPLSCLFFRVSVQTYKMFLAASLPQQPSSTAMQATSLSSIHNHYAPAPVQSAPPLTLKTIVPSSMTHISNIFRSVLANAMPTPAQSVYIFTVILIITLFLVLLIFKLLLGMGLLAFSRRRYQGMKLAEHESAHPHPHNHPHNHNGTTANHPTENTAKSRGYAVEGSKRIGSWGVVEVGDDRRRWVYADDPEGLKRVRAYEEKETKKGSEEGSFEHVQRYEMVAKRIW